MAVTIQQIADIVGVSRGTVDRAINNRGRIKPEVAAEIRKIAQDMGYTSNRRKVAAPSNSPHKIGVITQLAKSSFMLEVNRGIQAAASDLSYRNTQLLIQACDTVDEEEQLHAIDTLLKKKISALAIMPVNRDIIREKINYLTETLGIPVVTFNSDIRASKRNCFVGLDNKKSGCTAAGMMGMLTQGKGKVLVITGFFSNSVNSLRVDGFFEETRNSFKEMEIIGVQSSFDDAGEVKKIILNALDTFPDLAGIFVASGGQAGIWEAFKEKGLKKRPYVILYDLTSKNVKALKYGDADFLIDQEGYVQGYRAPMLLSDMLLNGMQPELEYYYTDIKLLTKYNVD